MRNLGVEEWLVSIVMYMYSTQVRKKVVKQQYLLHIPCNMANSGSLTAEIGSGVWGTISRNFVSCLRYCSNIAHRRLTKLCTMFGCLLGLYAIYTFLWALAS